MRLLSERFWSKVDKQGSTECWPWTASVVKNLGYGQFGMGGTMMRSHRVAWELSNGPIPAGMFVLHKCDNPPCCNPQHLFLGTQTDNMQDALAKGRHGHGTIGGPRKYSDALIKKALAEYESDDYMGLTAIATKYQISETHLRRLADKHGVVIRKKFLKLSPDETKEIRELYRTGNVTYAALGERYGVNQSMIGYIVTGHSHKQPK